MDDDANANLVDTVAMAVITGMQGDLAGGLDKLMLLTGTSYERCGNCLSVQSKTSFEAMVRTCIGVVPSQIQPGWGAALVTLGWIFAGGVPKLVCKPSDFDMSEQTADPLSAVASMAVPCKVCIIFSGLGCDASIAPSCLRRACGDNGMPCLPAGPSLSR